MGSQHRASSSTRPDARHTDRVDAGRARRDLLPLEAHADLGDIDRRPDPTGLLAEQDVARLQDLVPIRHGRMGVSPFTFYRGAAAIMASDLSQTATTDLRVQLCGDAHLSNFGLFKAVDRRLVFDVNDFDETAPGPFEWDLKRLGASVTIAARQHGASGKQARSATRASSRGYREVLRAAASTSPLDLRYFRIEVDSLVAKAGEKRRKQSRAAIAKATRKDSMRALEKLTEVVDGRRRIVAKPPVITRVDHLLEGHAREQMGEFFSRYAATLAPHRAAVLSRYRFVDMAHKIVGVGSVGTRCLIVLLESDEGAPLFLQFKEATRSVLERYVGEAGYESAGERVVRGQQLMQSTGDILLGWASMPRDDGSMVDFYFRQLWDGKGSVDVDAMGPKRLKNYAWHCGAALALAHARSGDAAMIGGYLGDDDTIDHVVAQFAARYADLNDEDYAAHQAAVADGVFDADDGR